MAVKTQVAASRTTAVEHTYEFMGYAFRVLSEVEATAALLDELLNPFAAQIDRDAPTYALRKTDRANRYTLHRDDESLLEGGRAAHPGAVIDFVMSDVTRQAIGMQDDFLALHASAASWRGHGIVMPAPPDSGKTTTIAGLVRAGFDYLSDEAALISPETGLIHPFPRPLVMETSSMRAVPGLAADLPDRFHEVMPRQQYYIPCNYIRNNSRGQPCPVRYVVAPFYSKGSTTRLEPMSRAEAATLLVEQSFNFRDHPSQGLALLARVLREADCFKLRIGDLAKAVTVVKGLFTSQR